MVRCWILSILAPRIIVRVWGSESLVIASHVTASHTTHGMSTTGFTDEPSQPETAENEIISSSDDDDDRDKHDSGFNIVHFWCILNTNTLFVTQNL